MTSRGGAIVKGPKTRASVRRLSIDTGTVEVLAVLQDEQRQLAEMCETTLEHKSFVFSFEPGRYDSPLSRRDEPRLRKHAGQGQGGK